MKKLVLLSSLLVVAACAKDDDKKSSNSSACSQAVVDAYNNVKIKARSTRTMADLREIRTACEEAKSLMGGGSCIAQNLKTGANQSVSYNDLKPACEEAEQKLNGNKQAPSAPGERSPAPTDGSPKMSSFTGIKLTVRDASLIEQALGLGTDGLIQGGRIVSKYSADRNAPFCFLGHSTTTSTVKAGDVILLSRMQTNPGQVIATTADQKINLGCANLTKTDMTIQELKNVFMGAADVEGVR